MKTQIAIAIALTLSTLAHADPLYVYQRNSNKLASTEPGLVAGNGKRLPVLIKTYGKDSIEMARMFGRGLVLQRYPFPEAKQLIINRAAQLYEGNPAFIKWFHADAAAGFDSEIRKEMREGK
jgi:hypothetical protein